MIRRLKRWVQGSNLYWAFKPFDPTVLVPEDDGSPDRLIAAHVVRLLAEDFDGWYVTEPKGDGYNRYEKYDPKRSYRSVTVATEAPLFFALTHIKRKITVHLYCGLKRARDGDGCAPWIFAWGGPTGRVSVDGQFLDEVSSIWLSRCYMTLKERHEEARKIANEAQASMKMNEEKWNLVEKYLDMKRTPEGALVPCNPITD